MAFFPNQDIFMFFFPNQFFLYGILPIPRPLHFCTSVCVSTWQSPGSLSPWRKRSQVFFTMFIELCKRSAMFIELCNQTFTIQSGGFEHIMQPIIDQALWPGWLTGPHQQMVGGPPSMLTFSFKVSCHSRSLHKDLFHFRGILWRWFI